MDQRADRYRQATAVAGHGAEVVIAFEVGERAWRASWYRDCGDG